MQIGPKFDSKGRCFLSRRPGASVALTKRVWEEHLRSHPDRGWYRHNFDAIKSVARNPDETRRSRKMDDVILCYKKVERIWFNDRISIPRQGYWCVVVGNSGNVLTIYF